MSDLQTSITKAFEYLSNHSIEIPPDLMITARLKGVRLPAMKGGAGSGHFGHEGRHGQIGGSLPGQGGGLSFTGRQETLNRIASSSGITSKIVYAQTPQDTEYGKKNNVPSNAGAVCDEQTGTIYVFDKAFESGVPIEGIVAHEEMHNVIYNSKYGQREKSNFINKNPDYSQDDFIKSAVTITSYTQYNWTMYLVDEIPFMRAVNETLCEIERMKVTDPSVTIPPMWEELYNNVKAD